jgi:hypothetical protein
MMNKKPARQTHRQRLFTCLRYGGLPVTAIGVIGMFVPGAYPTMLQGIEGYMILSGSILNAIGRFKVAKDPCPMSATNYCRTVAEGLQDVALIL